ncbi:penicillin-binding protein 1A [Actinobacillus equuli]|nr:penicillin-binding protein 1A [Actinobacillus equuli]
MKIHDEEQLREAFGTPSEESVTEEVEAEESTESEPEIKPAVKTNAPSLMTEATQTLQKFVMLLV